MSKKIFYSKTYSFKNYIIGVIPFEDRYIIQAVADRPFLAGRHKNPEEAQAELDKWAKQNNLTETS